MFRNMCDNVNNCNTSKHQTDISTNNSDDVTHAIANNCQSTSNPSNDFRACQAHEHVSNDYFTMNRTANCNQNCGSNKCYNIKQPDNYCCHGVRSCTLENTNQSRTSASGDSSDMSATAYYETDSITSGGSATTGRSFQDSAYYGGMRNGPTGNCNWQLFSVALRRSHSEGFGIAVIGGRDNPHCINDNSIVVSDVIPSGPAFGLLQVNDRIISANGLSFEYVDYGTAISVMKDAEQLNMIIKRRIPLPFVEYEQRTLKFTLSKSHKKDDFGIVLGCRYYIKEITNPKLAEKDPGLKEGDTVLRVNGQSLESLSLEEATRLLQRSREKLSLVVQRDVRRNPGSGSRWPSQSTVYERLGSVSATPRQSPTPVHYTQSANHNDGMSVSASPYSRKLSDLSPGPKRFSDSVITAAPYVTHVGQPSPLPQYNQSKFSMQNNAQLSNDLGKNNQQSINANQQYCSNQSACSPHLTGRPSQSLPKNYQQNIYCSQSPKQVMMQLNKQQQQGTQLMPIPQTQTSSIMSSSPLIERTSSYPPMQSHISQEHQPTSMGNAGCGNINNSGYTNEYTPNPLHGSQHSCSSLQHNSQLHSTNHFVTKNDLNPMARNEMRVLNFYKGSGSLGIRVIGGNQVGIYVSVVQDKSPAAINGIKVGDRIHVVNDFNMNGVTREEAVEYLLSLGENVTMQVEHSFSDDFSHVKSEQMGDNFYIRTHFQYQKRSSRQELNFNEGDIFHVTDTLAGGSTGYWQVTKVYSANELEIKSNEASGVIPNSKTAEILAKQCRIDSSTIGRSIFRRKLQTSRTKSLTNTMEEFSQDGSASDQIQVPAYERVSLKKPAFHRPIVLYGPLSDVARDLLLEKYPHQFGAVLSSPDMQPQNAKNSADGDTSPVQSVLHMSSIDAVMAAQKHCVLSISPLSVERLQLAQYAPIVILIDVDSRTRIRELRSKAGITTTSARRLMEHAAKLKRQHAHLLTATLDASKEDGWFEALRHLIFHLQERRVWMPEMQHPKKSLDDVLLFPLHNSMTDMQESDSLNRRMFVSTKTDNSIYDATTAGTIRAMYDPSNQTNRLPNGSSAAPLLNSSLAPNINEELLRLHNNFDQSYSSYSHKASPAHSFQQNAQQKPPIHFGAYVMAQDTSAQDYNGSLRRPHSSSSNSTYATNIATAASGSGTTTTTTTAQLQNLASNEPINRRNNGCVNSSIPQTDAERNGLKVDSQQANSIHSTHHYDPTDNMGDDPILKHYLSAVMLSQSSSEKNATGGMNGKGFSNKTEIDGNNDTATVNANFSLRRTAPLPKTSLKNGISNLS